MKIRERLSYPMRGWLAVAVGTFPVALAGFALVQHALRVDANYPQEDLASAAVASLEAGSRPSAVIPRGEVDPTADLAPFVIVYNQASVAVASSAAVAGKPPVPPAGVFAYVANPASQGVDRVTWQPTPSLRIAAVVREATTKSGARYYVLAGRSLYDVERREKVALGLVALAWSATLALGALVSWLLLRRR